MKTLVQNGFMTGRSYCVGLESENSYYGANDEDLTWLLTTALFKYRGHHKDLS